MNNYIPIEDKNIKIHGRTSPNIPLTLFWTGSGVEVNVDGSELYFEIETDFSVFEQWIRIEINGYCVIRMSLDKGENMICAFSGMSPKTIKNVRLIKEVQPMQCDSLSFLRIHSIKGDGILYPVEEKKFKVEVIGDSITSGEGLAGNKGISEWIPMVFTTQNHYVEQVAKMINADYRIISQSGWGVYCSWDNNLNHTLPKIYHKVCSVLDNEVSKQSGSCDDYDFTSWEPNVIIVNLGCNDSFSFTSPAWTDPQTGIVYKQHINEDGSYNVDDIKKISDAVYKFLEKIRRLNPNSYILWVYGMIGRGLLECIERTIYSYAIEKEDKKVAFQLLPDLKDEWIGANNHPGVLSHSAAARAIYERLKEIII